MPSHQKEHASYSQWTHACEQQQVHRTLDPTQSSHPKTSARDETKVLKEQTRPRIIDKDFKKHAERNQHKDAKTDRC